MKKKVLSILFEYFLLTFGCFLFSVSWTNIFLPNALVSGGMSGMCTVIQYATGFPMAWSYAILNVILILLGFIILGRTFGIRTIYSLVIISVFLSIIPSFGIPELHLNATDKIMTPIIASFIEAIGIAIVLNHGGSSGGTDIIAMIVNKYWPISIGRVYMVLDILIIASVLLLPGRTIDDAVYGYMAVICFSLSLDYIMLGRKSSVQILVFSDKYEEIANFINDQMHRGVTAIEAQGWYSKAHKQILLILVRRSQLKELTHRVKELDPRAFVTISPVTSVYGEGFEEIKSGVNLRKKRSLSDKNFSKN